MPDPGDGSGHSHEPHGAGDAGRLNWLRAGVLGANDGIVSTSALVIGVAAAGASDGAIVTAGLAGLAAGAMSMAAGEYVSVSTQRDTEKAMLDKERYELHHFPEHELEELTGLYQAKGLSRGLAEQVAAELTSADALAAHAEVELRLDPEELTSPWQAAFASMAAFTVGAIGPLLTIILLPTSVRILVTVAMAAIVLGLTGWLSARLGGAPALRAVLRNVGGGLAAMAVTFLVGTLFGATVS